MPISYLTQHNETYQRNARRQKPKQMDSERHPSRIYASESKRKQAAQDLHPKSVPRNVKSSSRGGVFGQLAPRTRKQSRRCQTNLLFLLSTNLAEQANSSSRSLPTRTVANDRKQAAKMHGSNLHDEASIQANSLAHHPRRQIKCAISLTPFS